jgi:hypothetical protein
MSIELIRDLINYENMIGEGNGQTMVNGDIILGERSQEIMNILHMDGKATITSSECFEDKVSIEGKMSFELLYSSNDSKESMNKINAVSNFSHIIQIPGTKEHMLCKTDVRIEHIGVEQINNRKIKVNAIINLMGKVYQKSVVEAIVDIKAQDIQVLKNNIAIDEFVAENAGQSIVKGKIELLEDELAINTVLKRDIAIMKKNIHIDEGKIVINANAQIRLLYDDEQGNLNDKEYEIPFSSELYIPNLKGDMKCDVVFHVEEAYDEIKEDDSGNRKIIETEIIVGSKVKAYSKKEIDNVVDAYSPNQRYEMEREILKPLSFFGEGTSIESFNEKMSFPVDVKPIKSVLNCIAKPVATDIKAIENKVIVEGIINCCLIYLASTEEGGLTSYEEELPFKSLIDIPGVKIEMLSEAEIMLNSIGFDVLPENQVALKMTITANAKVYNKAISDVSIGAFEAELPENIVNMPSLVIYSVQHNDSLWKIAKKFNTTIEDIVELNEIDNPDVLQIGRKLLIPKKSFMK